MIRSRWYRWIGAMVAGIMYIVKRKDDSIDYDSFIFRLMAADVMDMDRSGDMSLFIKTLINGGAKKIVVDMDGLEFIDSAGISVLIDAAKMVRNNEGDIALLRVPQRIQTIFQPIKLNRFMRMFENEDEAISFFRMV